MRYAITHTTTYRYEQDVSVSHHVARLAPRNSICQQCLEHSLHISPTPSLQEQHQDYFGNTTTVISLEIPHRELVLTSRSFVQTGLSPRPQPQTTAPWEQIRALCRDALEAGARAA